MKSPSSKLALAVALAATALVALAAPKAVAGPDNRLERLSHSLEGISSELCEEFGAHYRHTAIYHHLVNDAHRIEDEARHIERLAHDPYASLRHIQHDLEEIDGLAHHLHNLIDRAERGYYGRIHGCTDHVHDLLSSLEHVIHAMEDEVRSMMHRGPSCETGRGHSYGHRGHHDEFSFGRGGFRISIRR